MSSKKILGPPTLFLLLAVLAGGVALAAGTPAIERSLIGGGGQTAIGGNTIVESVLGQSSAGESTGGTIAACSGFWCGGAPGRVLLPLVLRAAPSCDAYEPNNSQASAWGPLVSNQSYQAKLCSGDSYDYYYFDTSTANTVQMRLQLPASLVGHVAIWLNASDMADCGTGPVTSPDYIRSCSIPRPGRYYVRVYSGDGTHDDANFYVLKVTFQ